MQKCVLDVLAQWVQTYNRNVAHFVSDALGVQSSVPSSTRKHVTLARPSGEICQILQLTKQTVADFLPPGTRGFVQSSGTSQYQYTRALSKPVQWEDIQDHALIILVHGFAGHLLSQLREPGTAPRRIYWADETTMNQIPGAFLPRHTGSVCFDYKTGRAFMLPVSRYNIYTVDMDTWKHSEVFCTLPCKAIDWNPSQSLLAVDANRNGLVLVDAAGTSYNEMYIQEASSTVIRWNPAGTHLVIGSIQGTIRIYQLHPSTKKLTRVFHGLEHTRWVESLCWHPDSTFIAVLRGDGSLVLQQNIHSNQWIPLTAKTKSTYFMTYVSWNPNGDSFATATQCGRVLIWDLASFSIRTILPMPTSKSATFVEWNSSGLRLAAHSKEVICVWH